MFAKYEGPIRSKKRQKYDKSKFLISFNGIEKE